MNTCVCLSKVGVQVDGNIVPTKDLDIFTINKFSSMMLGAKN